MERKNKPKAAGCPGFAGLCSQCSPPSEQHSAVTPLGGQVQQEGEILSQGTSLLPEILNSAGSVQELCGFAISNNFFCTKNGISVSALHIPPGFHLMMN